jgi:CO dehydrogenase maturation factor
MDQMGGKKTILTKLLSAYYDGKPTSVIKETWTIDQIPTECVSKKDNLYLMQIGKLQHFGEGCACPMGGLSKDFVSNLKLAPKDVAIIDTEAGTEHLARGVATGVDVVLMVLDPSYESIKLSKKTATMVGEANKSVHFILNKINDQLAAAMIQKLGEKQVIAQIPFSSEIQEKGLSGEELNATASGLDDVTNFVIQTSQRSQN